MGIRLISLFAILPVSSAFLATPKERTSGLTNSHLGLFDKIFEEEGMLGKGISVAKVQVAMRSLDRSDQSIFGLLQDHASLDSDSNEDLSRMANKICLDLMRKTDDWVAACSTSKWFSEKDAAKAESYYNEL